jgi:hypothetical protein
VALAPASSHGVDTASANTWSGNQTAPAWIASGLTGATAASRYVGATASGAPASGTFAVGDFAIDQSGKVFVCTSAGTPGTWVQVGAAGGVTILNYTEGASLGRIWASSIGTSGVSVGILARRYFTPAAGTRTYSIRGWRGSADATVTAGAAGATAYYPMYIRVTSGS